MGNFPQHARAAPVYSAMETRPAGKSDGCFSGSAILDRSRSPMRIRFFPIFPSGLRRKSRRLATSVSTVETVKFIDQISARQRMELYCELHPGSPSAVRRPTLVFRSGVWTAVLGQSVRKGIAGFGPTVEAALRAFDAQYFEHLRPPLENQIARQRA